MLKTLCLILITLVISQTVCAQIETSSVASQFFQEKIHHIPLQINVKHGIVIIEGRAKDHGQ